MSFVQEAWKLKHSTYDEGEGLTKMEIDDFQDVNFKWATSTRKNKNDSTHENSFELKEICCYTLVMNTLIRIYTVEYQKCEFIWVRTSIFL